jgi:hypothetical protein
MNIPFDLLWTILHVINEERISINSNGRPLETVRQHLVHQTPMVEARCLVENPMAYTQVLELCRCDHAIFNFIEQAARVLCNVKSKLYRPWNLQSREGLRLVFGPINVRDDDSTEYTSRA